VEFALPLEVGSTETDVELYTGRVVDLTEVVEPGAAEVEFAGPVEVVGTTEIDVEL